MKSYAIWLISILLLLGQASCISEQQLSTRSGIPTPSPLVTADTQTDQYEFNQSAPSPSAVLTDLPTQDMGELIAASPSLQDDKVAVLFSRSVKLIDPGDPSAKWSKPVDDATCIAWASDGSSVAVGQGNGTVVIIDATSGDARTTIQGSSDLVKALHFSPDGSLLAIAYGDTRAGSVRLTIVDTSQWMVVRSFDNFTFGMFAWSPGSDMLALVIGYVVDVVDLHTGDSVQIADNAGYQIERITWFDNNTLLMQRDGLIQKWDLSAQTLTAQHPNRALITDDIEIHNHMAYIAAGSSVFAWNVNTDEIGEPFALQQKTTNLAINETSQVIAFSGSESDSISIWSLEKTSRIHEISLDDDGVKALDWTSTGKWLIVTTYDHRIVAYSADNEWESQVLN